MNEEDEAFEDLAKRQGDWGMQGSRKHQIMRYAENVENKGTSMTQDEIIEMAMEAEFVSHGKPSDEESELFVCLDKDIYKFAALVAAKEREACAKVVGEFAQNYSAYELATIIRARGQA